MIAWENRLISKHGRTATFYQGYAGNEQPSITEISSFFSRHTGHGFMLRVDRKFNLIKM